jgi:hypothetical protein
LPSSGKTVKYRPFLVKEHKVLLTMTEADDSEVSRIVKELVDVCTFNELDVSKLPHFDIEYMFLHLRAKSIGENVEVIVNCECGEKIEASFNIEDVKVESKADNSNKIMLDDEHGIEMDYPKFEDVVKIYSTKETEAVVNLITSCVKGIFDGENYWEAEDQTKEELEEFVLSLTKQQFDKIEEFFINAPKVVQVIECDCKECGKHNVTRLEGLSNFFV